MFTGTTHTVQDNVAGLSEHPSVREAAEDVNSDRSEKICAICGCTDLVLGITAEGSVGQACGPLDTAYEVFAGLTMGGKAAAALPAIDVERRTGYLLQLAAAWLWAGRIASRGSGWRPDRRR